MTARGQAQKEKIFLFSAGKGEVEVGGKGRR